jgi:pectate lyase
VKNVALSIIFFLLSYSAAFAQTPSFPGAQGWGATAQGARGGTGYAVRFVDTLNFSGPGSISAALTDPAGGKGVFVVFRVSGYIDVPPGSNLTIAEPHFYVAGQTAPGGGVCLRLSPSAQAGDFLLAIDADHVIVRYLCMRHGDDPSGDDQGTNIVVAPGRSNIIVDHIVSQWGSDEAAAIGSNGVNNITNVTFQRSAFIESLQPHATGLLIGDDHEQQATNVRVSVHNSFFAHNNSRNPRITSRATDGIGTEIVNNAIYGTTESGGVDWDSTVDIVGNYAKETPGIPGLDWENDPGFNGRIWFANRQDLFQSPPITDPSIHMRGNVVEYKSGTKRTDGSDYDLIRDETTLAEPIPVAWRRTPRMAQPPFPITEVSAQEAWNDVVVKGNVGNTHYVDEAGIFRRRPIDAALERVLNDARNGEGQSDLGDYISTPNDVGGYPPIIAGTPYTDTDNDGMGDQWESNNGLDPTDPTDAYGDMDGDGYLNIEEFLNSS